MLVLRMQEQQVRRQLPVVDMVVLQVELVVVQPVVLVLRDYRQE